jgi:hypothetical protein
VTLRSEVKDDASFQRLSDYGGNVRFGSKADICAALTYVRFTPNSDRESGHVPMVMSALLPKVDMYGALAHVCYGPEADMVRYSITSSAMDIIPGGTSMPSTRAV